MSGPEKKGHYPMAALVPYDGNEPLDKKTRKELEEIEGRGRLARRASEQAESNAAYAADLRIANGYALAGRTVQHATMLNREISMATRDNPGLEMLVKPIEEEAAAAARYIVYRYMAR